MSERAARFEGAVAVVTGGGAGIGAATALRLAAEGAAVVVVDTDEGAGDAVVAHIGKDGGRGCFVHADVADEQAWSRLLDTVHRRFGRISVLVGNAATVEVAAAGDLARESWDRQIAVNLTAAFLGVRACLDDLRATAGSVVLVSSVHALMGLPGHPAYAATKAGLTGLTRQLAVEYGPAVRVNAVLPGPILTAAWDRVDAEDRSRSAAATAAGRLGTPEEVAAAIAFLASPDATYVTGASLVVDGGWSVHKESA